MSESTKIEFRHRRIQQIADITDIVTMLFPGSRKQRHAAACVLFELKWAHGIVPNLAYLEAKYRISRRVWQRARAKLSRLGLIEHVGMLNSRHKGQAGWRLSGRFAAALRLLAERIEGWRNANGAEGQKKEAAMVGLLRA